MLERLLASGETEGRMAKDENEHPHLRALKEAARAYPETEEASPWGHCVFKVRGKSFVFFGGDEGRVSLSVKLPRSGDAALSLPFAEPTGYGLGKSGWVTASFPAGEPLPFSILRAWLDESFRAIAPKTVVARLDGTSARAPAKAGVPSKKPASTKAKKSSAKPPKH